MSADAQTKREIARDLLEVLFTGRDRVAIADALAAAGRAGVSRRTLQRAAAAAGVREVHNGPHGGFWEKGR